MPLFLWLPDHAPLLDITEEVKPGKDHSQFSPGQFRVGFGQDPASQTKSSCEINLRESFDSDIVKNMHANALKAFIIGLEKEGQAVRTAFT